MFNNFLEKIEDIIKKFDYTSSYLKSLTNFIISEENKNSKSIIFVNHRMICQEINKKLNLIFDGLYEKKEIKEKIFSKYVIGISTESKNNLLNFTKKDLDNNIKNFRNNDNCKVLIATNVVEEGIDIPDCNNVICLSTIKTIKEYIQKSGRARQKNSKIILFSTKKNEQINKDKIQEIKIAIKVMKNLINDNSIIPKVKKYNYINNYNIIESNKGAKIYLDYSKVVVEEFVSKLFNDGYTWNRVELKDMELKIDNKIKYFPYLSLPSVLECYFKKIFEFLKIILILKINLQIMVKNILISFILKQ
jgi:ERCC4-related helicase